MSQKRDWSIGNRHMDEYMIVHPNGDVGVAYSEHAAKMFANSPRIADAASEFLDEIAALHPPAHYPKEVRAAFDHLAALLEIVKQDRS